MILREIDRTDTTTQAKKDQSRRQQPHRPCRGNPLPAVDSADQFRRHNHRASDQGNYYSRQVPEECPIGAREALVVVLEPAERRERYPASYPIQTIGYEAKQIPGHGIEPEGGASEQPSHQQEVGV